MKTIKALGLVAAMSLALEPIAMLAPALAVSAPSGIDSRLHLDWDAGTGRGGKPVIQGYDESVWAVALDYHGHPVEVALATVRAVRANTAAILRRLPEEAWTREGRHTGSGRYTAQHWLAIYAEHLEIHARQIEANLAAWEAAGRPS